MNRTLKVVGKLSLWGIFLGFLLWLAKQLLTYLLALLLPWLNWLLGWLFLVLGIVALLAVGSAVGLAYIGYRSWKKKRRRREEESDKSNTKE